MATSDPVVKPVSRRSASGKPASAPCLRPVVARLPRYQAGRHRLADETKELRAVLSANENSYGCSPDAQQALRRYAERGELHRYGDAEQRESLVADLAAFCQQREGFSPSAEQILLGNGSDELIALLAHATIERGCNAIVCAHTFPLYALAVRAHGGEVREVARLAPSYALSVERCAALCDERTRLFFLANPDNPTGRIEERETLQALRAALPRSVLLVLDSAYAEYVTSERYDSGLAMACADESVVMLRTFSKVHGLAALRLGWAVGSRKLVAALQGLRLPFSVNTAALAAASAALKDRKHVLRSCESNLRERTRLADWARGAGLRPLESHANFLLLDCGNVSRARSLYERWEEAGFLVRLCAQNGLAHTLRVTVGTEQEMSALFSVPLETSSDLRSVGFSEDSEDKASL